MVPSSTSDLLTEKEAAAFLGIAPNTLAIWRCTRRYPLSYLRVGSRLIRYRRSDLVDFLQRGEVAPAVAAQ